MTPILVKKIEKTVTLKHFSFLRVWSGIIIESRIRVVTWFYIFLPEAARYSDRFMFRQIYVQTNWGVVIPTDKKMYNPFVPSDIFLIFNTNQGYLFFYTYPSSQISFQIPYLTNFSTEKKFCWTRFLALAQNFVNFVGQKYFLNLRT